MLANMSCSCSVKVLLKSTASSGHNEATSAGPYIVLLSHKAMQDFRVSN